MNILEDQLGNVILKNYQNRFGQNQIYANNCLHSLQQNAHFIILILLELEQNIKIKK